MKTKVTRCLALFWLCSLLVHCAATGAGPTSENDDSASASASSSSSSTGGVGGADGSSSSMVASSSSAAGSTSSSSGNMEGKSLVVLNEIESNGGMPGDWVELHNEGDAIANIGGWVLMDDDDTHVYVVPSGTTIAPGQYFVLDEADFGYGLGAADSVRLFDDMNNLYDEYTWAEHAVTTYGRCPNGIGGSFQTTAEASKGAPNKC